MVVGAIAEEDEGYCWWWGTSAHQGFVKFDVDQLRDKRWLSARLEWEEVSWASVGDIASNESVINGLYLVYPDGSHHLLQANPKSGVDVTSVVRNWVFDRTPNLGLVFGGPPPFPPRLSAHWCTQIHSPRLVVQVAPSWPTN